jgi:hypothetical protein
MWTITIPHHTWELPLETKHELNSRPKSAQNKNANFSSIFKILKFDWQLGQRFNGISILMEILKKFKK